MLKGQFWRDVLHRAGLHAHEITAILVAEGARSSVFFILLLVAAMLVAFAFQQLLRIEEH